MQIKNFLVCALCSFLSLLFAQQAVTDVAILLEADLFWDTLSQTGMLAKNGRQIQFRAGEPLVLLNNSEIALLDSPQRENGNITVNNAFVSYARDFFDAAPPESYFRIGAILIDPGHGGKDPGTTATHTIKGKKTQLYEKDMVLSISRDLFSHLKTKYPDKKIFLTRSDDTFLTLDQRVEKANSVQLAENEAILYISVHVNSAFDKKASGFEVWYLSPKHRRTVLSAQDASATEKELVPILNSMLEEEYTTESILIAKSILDGIEAEVGTLSQNRGLKAEEWFVVRNAYMPSVLAEVGFLSNPTEAALLADPTYLRKLSLGIYNGLVSFITLFERSKGFTVAQ